MLSPKLPALLTFTLITSSLACVPPEEGDATGEPGTEQGEESLFTRRPRSCFVAFIHGMGRDLRGNQEGARAYWAPEGGNWRNPQPMWEHSLINWVTSNETSCRSKAIGYNGLVGFNEDVGHVGRELRSFIDEHQIPDHRLIIIAHSMGGLVARYLLNTAEPNSPTSQDPRWGPGDLQNFALVKAKTGYVISLQTPHFGSEGADALYGQATFPTGNDAGFFLRLLGIEKPTGATNSVRRQMMESWATSMGDAGRTVKIWALAGQATYNMESRRATSEKTDSDDSNLHTASTILFGISNQYYFRNDGLVERRSAHGKSILKHSPGWFQDHIYSSERSVQGAFERWVQTPLNHNHGRFSDIWTRFENPETKEVHQLHLGDKIRMHGLGLPCSDPGTAFSKSGRCNLQVPDLGLPR